MLAARQLPFSKVLAARKANLITARARKVKRSARLLANTRRDHSIPLIVGQCPMRIVVIRFPAFFEMRELMVLGTDQYFPWYGMFDG